MLQNGRKVGEVRTPAKVFTQRMSWVLLALALLVPWLMIQFWNAPLRSEMIEMPAKLTASEQTRLSELSEKKNLDKKEKADLVSLEKKANASPRPVPIKDGKVVEHRIRELSPNLPPQVEEYAGPDVAKHITDVPQLIGDYYTIAFLDGRAFHIPFWTFWGLLLLTLLSYLWHRESRKTRVGQPIEIAE